MKTMVILLHVSIGDASCVHSELSQDLGIHGEGKLVPVHFDRKFLEIVPSFGHSSPGGQTTQYNGILKDRASNHACCHHLQGQPVEERLAKLKDSVHVTVTPPLTMVEGIE